MSRITWRLCSGTNCWFSFWFSIPCVWPVSLHLLEVFRWCCSCCWSRNHLFGNHYLIHISKNIMSALCVWGGVGGWMLSGLHWSFHWSIHWYSFLFNIGVPLNALCFTEVTFSIVVEHCSTFFLHSAHLANDSWNQKGLNFLLHSARLTLITIELK